ncbi:MAG: fused DSP-PTPase phosphatase/NAD kinase-like protein [Planctomycetota bacterium]
MPHNFSFVLPGQLAGMERPGNFDELERDLEFIRAQGITCIVSLTEQRLDADKVARYGFKYIHLAVRDFGPPSLVQIENLVDSFALHQPHGAMVIHCGAGLGRTGTMLACILVAGGFSADEAIFRIRKLRPYSIETYEQERAIFDYATVRRESQAKPLNLDQAPGRKSDFIDDTDPRKKSRMMKGLKLQNQPPTGAFKVRQDNDSNDKTTLR